ncbi:MAG: cupin domain-containing protein, partial [candidate division NC10 bacterium]
PKLFGEKGYTSLERIWGRPTFEVNGMLSGFTGEGAKTVLPAVAMAKVSMRLVPTQDPDKIASLFEATPNGRLHVTRRAQYPVVSFDGSSEKWHVLGAGLFQGKIRAVISSLGPRSKGVKTDKVILDPGQMKLFYVLEGKVALQYNGENHVLEAGDSAYLDGGTPHGWENLGPKPARALWVILG